MIGLRSHLFPRTLLELIAERASAREGAPAISAPGKPSLSYRALATEVDRAGAALGAIGIGVGTRVALALASGPETAVASLSSIAWAICVPLNPTLDRRTYDLLLANLHVDALIAAAGQDSNAAAAAYARGMRVVWLAPRSGAAAGTFDFRTDATRTAIPSRRPLPADIALLLHTSGTTSKPKVVPLTQTQVLARSRAQPIDGADRCLCVAPLFTGSALHSLLAPLAAGADIGFAHGPGPAAIIDALNALGTTYFSASPTVLSSVVDALNHGGATSFASLRFVRSSSSALDAELQRRIEGALGVPVVQGYGMTEAGPIAQNPLPPAQRKPGSVGLSVGPDIAILDENGGSCERGVEGAVMVRGAGVMCGYADDAQANLEAFHDGWFRTGDTGHLDEDGYLFLTGRMKDIVNRGGFKISPAQIDEVLLRHPDVREAVAFAVSHPTLGEDLAAAAVLHVGASTTAQQLRDFAFEHLEPYKVPSMILLVSTLDRDALGKVNRRSLARTLGTAMRHEFVPPRNVREERVATIFSQTLHIGRVGAFDNFFALGGDSLRGMQAIVQLNVAFGSNVTSESLFRWPTVAQLASGLAAEPSDRRAPPPIIGRRAGIRRSPTGGKA
jgi:acyl-coenzyme A synthetase/AMP-(fatty) acid ligase/acyl carrier protein